MVLKPGKSTSVYLSFNMHGEMGGKHDFRLKIPTNDPTTPVREITILSNWVP